MPQNTPKRITDRKYASLLVLMCAIVYFTSYLTRVNYKAVISEVVKSEGITNSMASVALTGLFITYGLGQLISGWLGDRIKPRYIMTVGMIIASSMNILLPLKTDPVYMTAVWCVNGLGQAMMWPPIVKILTNHLTNEQYLDATVRVSSGSAVGSIAVYLLAPPLISLSGWRSVFYVCAALGLCGTVLIFFGLRFIERYAEKYGETPKEESIPTHEKGAADHLSLPRYFPILFGMILLVIVLQGMLRDGIDTWMPTFMADHFDMSEAKSILTAVVLPIFALVSYQAAKVVHNRLFKNELICSAAIFGFGAVSLLVLAFAANVSPVLSVVCFMLITGAMHGVNLVLTAFVPRRFKKYGNISTVSGTLNFATYVGSAVSTYGFARLIDGFGWTQTIAAWIIICSLGVLCCVSIAGLWKKFTE